jgi:hypothetical protein
MPQRKPRSLPVERMQGESSAIFMEVHYQSYSFRPQGTHLDNTASY